MSMDNHIKTGLELISGLDAESLTALEIRDILSLLVSKNFDVIDAILNEAVRQGLVSRCNKTYTLNREVCSLKYDRPVIRIVDERGKCVLCGKALTKCCYILFTSRTYGPFGVGCVKKIHLS